MQHDNLGSVAILEGPGYDAPRFVQFEAAPRPAVRPSCLRVLHLCAWVLQPCVLPV